MPWKETVVMEEHVRRRHEITDPEWLKIERFFGAIKRFRRVATRYDKKPENFLGFTWFAAILVEGI